MKKKNVYEFADLLRHAEDLGYEWNDAHKHINHCRPLYELNSYDIDEIIKWVMEEDNIDTIRIVASFMIENRAKTLTII